MTPADRRQHRHEAEVLEAIESAAAAWRAGSPDVTRYRMRHALELMNCDPTDRATLARVAAGHYPEIDP